jgi:aspartate aminotransferase
MSFLATKLDRIKPSPTIAMSAKARALKAEGKDVIELAAGEPDFPTPDHIIRSAEEAMAKGDTKYTDPDGTPVLKQAVVKNLSVTIILSTIQIKSPLETVVNRYSIML